MDQIDIKILSLLEKNARMPLKQLAESIYLSSPATAARIEKLEQDGVISGYSVRLNYKKLGFPIIAFINLEVSPSQKAEFYPYICAHPNVIECSCVTGDYSMIIKVALTAPKTSITLLASFSPSALPKHRLSSPHRRNREAYL